MKKSTIAVGILVILGAAYVGTSWYTGNVIESNIDQNVVELTQKINDYQSEENVTISYSDYQKGVFSSKLHVTITTLPKQEVIANQTPTTIFNDDITIHHGPFPIAALSNGTFSPQMAWIEYEMTEKAYPELWKLAGNQSFISASLGVSYQEYLTLKIMNKALSITDTDSELLDCQDAPECKLDLSAGHVSITSDKDISNLSINSQLDKIIYSQGPDNVFTLSNFTLSAQPNAEKTGVSYQLDLGELSIIQEDYYSTPNLTINNIKSKGNVIHINENVDSQTTVDKITFIPDTKKTAISPTIVINELTFNQKSLFNQATNTVDGALNVVIGNALFGQQNLGNGALDFDFQGVNGEFMSSKAGFYRNKSENLNQNDQLSMKLALNKFNWHNSVGDINANATLDMSGTREEIRQFDIDNMDKIKLHVDMPFNVLAHFQAQVENPSTDAVTEGQIRKASQSLQMISQMFLHDSGLFTFEKGGVAGIYSDVDYAKDRDEVNVNGKAISKEKFLNNF